MNDRRRFLKSGSLALAAALGELPTRTAAIGRLFTCDAIHGRRTARLEHELAIGPPVTPNTFAEAAKLAQYEMTDAERRIAAGSWRTSMAPLLPPRSGGPG